jgi:hypothetical protein
MKTVISYLRSLIDPHFMGMGIRVALIVGTILVLINHGVALIQHRMTAERWLSALLTYFVPYCVNVHGQWLSQWRSKVSSKS